MSGRAEKVHYVASTTFTIPEKYKDLKLIGKGSYGVVCSAADTTLNKNVAIKKITPMAKHTVDAKHVLREIRLMRHMGKHENIVGLEDLFVRDAADELYIVMELMDSDLHRVLQSKQTLTENHFRHFMHQLFCGLKYLHDNRIIHRDLKPGNLLVTRDCKLRITDFGLARARPLGQGPGGPDDVIDEPMTEHVVTRWYRSPELMLCPDGFYDYSVDTWSCGCILAEMLRRRPLFPGKNFIEQLTMIFDVLGAPSPADVAHIKNVQAVKFLEQQQRKRKVPWETLFPRAPEGSVSLLEHLINFAPSRRLSAEQALRSPFFAALASSKLTRESLVFPPVSAAFEFRFEEDKTMSKFQLKQLIQREATSIRADRVGREASGKQRAAVVADSSAPGATDLQTNPARGVPETSAAGGTVEERGHGTVGSGREEPRRVERGGEPREGRGGTDRDKEVGGKQRSESTGHGRASLVNGRHPPSSDHTDKSRAVRVGDDRSRREVGGGAQYAPLDEIVRKALSVNVAEVYPQAAAVGRPAVEEEDSESTTNVQQRQRNKPQRRVTEDDVGDGVGGGRASGQRAAKLSPALVHPVEQFNAQQGKVQPNTDGDGNGKPTERGNTRTAPVPAVNNVEALMILDQSGVKAMPYLSPNRRKPLPARATNTENPRDVEAVTNPSFADGDEDQNEIEALRRRLAALERQAGIEGEEEDGDSTDSDEVRAEGAVGVKHNGLPMRREGGTHGARATVTSEPVAHRERRVSSERSSSTSRPSRVSEPAPKSRVPPTVGKDFSSLDENSSTSAKPPVRRDVHVPGLGKRSESTTRMDRGNKNPPQKTVTVPKSPKFSLMSWQRRNNVGFLDSSRRPKLPADAIATGSGVGVEQRPPPANATDESSRKPRVDPTKRSEASRDRDIGNSGRTNNEEGGSEQNDQSSYYSSSINPKARVANMAEAESQLQRRWEILELEQKLRSDRERLLSLAQSRRVDAGTGTSNLKAKDAGSGSGRPRSSSAGRASGRR